MKNNFFKYILLVLLLATYFPVQAIGDMYRWTDDKGTVHLSDSPKDVPPMFRNRYKVTDEPHRTNGEQVIPFERTSSGLILIDVVLNDVKAKMVFDTGADVVVITHALYKRLNQDLSQGSAIIKLNTSCGEVEGKTFAMNKIEFGGITKEKVTTVVTPKESVFKGFDGLLGLSFLEDIKATVDYKNKRIIITK